MAKALRFDITSDIFDNINILEWPNRYPFVGMNKLMDDLEFPYWRIWETGVLYDHYNQCERYPQKDGSIDIVSYCTGQRLRRKIDFLVRYYFYSPWYRWFYVPYKSMGFMNCPRYCVLADGTIFSTYTMTYLQGDYSIDGYKKVCIQDVNGIPETYLLHRIVAQAFIPNPENKPEVNHIDGNKDNNHISNLEWVYGWENVHHALQTGLRKSTLTDNEIHAICQRLQDGWRVIDIMTDLNVPKHAVLGIKSGCHARISNQYTFKHNVHF